MNSEFADISYKWAGGGMVSTSLDMCRFGEALLQGKLLKLETVARMWAAEKWADGKPMNRSLGWSLDTLLGNAIVQHGGAQQMTRTFFIIVPRDKLVVSVLTNYESHNPGELARAVLNAWYRE